MKKKSFSVEQIVGVLKQVEMGVPVAELIRQVGISEQTLYRWKKRYQGLETDQVRQNQAAAGRKRKAEETGTVGPPTLNWNRGPIVDGPYAAAHVRRFPPRRGSVGRSPLGATRVNEGLEQLATWPGLVLTVDQELPSNGRTPKVTVATPQNRCTIPCVSTSKPLLLQWTRKPPKENRGQKEKLC